MRYWLMWYQMSGQASLGLLRWPTLGSCTVQPFHMAGPNRIDLQCSAVFWASGGLNDKRAHLCKLYSLSASPYFSGAAVLYQYEPNGIGLAASSYLSGMWNLVLVNTSYCRMVYGNIHPAIGLASSLILTMTVLPFAVVVLQAQSTFMTYSRPPTKLNITLQQEQLLKQPKLGLQVIKQGLAKTTLPCSILCRLKPMHRTSPCWETSAHAVSSHDVTLRGEPARYFTCLEQPKWEPSVMQRPFSGAGLIGHFPNHLQLPCMSTLSPCFSHSASSICGITS